MNKSLYIFLFASQFILCGSSYITDYFYGLDVDFNLPNITNVLDQNFELLHFE